MEALAECWLLAEAERTLEALTECELLDGEAECTLETLAEWLLLADGTVECTPDEGVLELGWELTVD